MRFLVFLLLSACASAAELDGYYLAPFLNGSPAPSGYVPCNGTSYSGYWQNNTGKTIYVTKYFLRLSTNVSGGYTSAEMVIKIDSGGEQTFVGSVQTGGWPVNHTLDFAPDSYKVVAGGKIWVYAYCLTSGSGNFNPYFSGMSAAPTMQAIGYAHFRDNP